MAVTEYQAGDGAANHILFVDRKPVDSFNNEGALLGNMWQLFGEETDFIINELNEVPAA